MDYASAATKNKDVVAERLIGTTTFSQSLVVTMDDICRSWNQGRWSLLLWLASVI